jgi:hypothetical protein
MANPLRVPTAVAYSAEIANVAAIRAKLKLTNNKKRSKNDIVPGYPIKVTGVCQSALEKTSPANRAPDADGSVPHCPLRRSSARLVPTSRAGTSTGTLRPQMLFLCM